MDFIFPLEQVSLPIVGNEKRFPVRRIYCVGRNYLDHIRETAGAGVIHIVADYPIAAGSRV